MRKNNFINRLKLAINILMLRRGNIRIMTCENCGSINISPVIDTDDYVDVPSELERDGVKKIWIEMDVCHNCGANVVEKQYWSY